MLDRIIKSQPTTRRFGKPKRIIITIIDEARSGGSVSQATSILEDLLAEKRKSVKIDINIITIAEKGGKQCQDYVHLKSRGIVKEFIVPRVFTMDSNKFLFPLIKSKQRMWPFHSRPRLGITQKAIAGRADLLSDLEAIHQNGRTFGRAKKLQRLFRLPK